MKVVLFGVGKRLNPFVDRDGVLLAEIVGVVDNDKEKQGSMWRQYEISSPEILSWLDYDKVVVASDKYYDKIYLELIEKYNVLPDKIIPLNCLVIPEKCNLGDIELQCDLNKCYTVEELASYVKHSDNKLIEFFFFSEHRIINKWWHYFEIYNKYFHKFMDKPVRMLEIGVFKGGSLQMWKNYFGRDAVIVGIDIDESCQQYEEEQIHVRIGSQDNPPFLKKICEEFGPFDVILDDGSHMMAHQIISFETLFPLLNDNGIYMCEDTHTSYWQSYSDRGGDTFVEYSKKLVDEVNFQYIQEDEKASKSRFRDMIKAVHFYDSIIVFEKGKKGLSFWSKRGVDE